MSIKIGVFGSIAYDNCFSAGWGPSQSQEEITEVVSHLLKNRYGDQVDIEYIDISDDRMDDFPQITEIVRNKNILLPIVAINGEPLWTGGVSYPNIVDELNKRGIKALEK